MAGYHVNMGWPLTADWQSDGSMYGSPISVSKDASMNGSPTSVSNDFNMNQPPAASVPQLLNPPAVTTNVTKKNMPSPFAEWLGSEGIEWLNREGFINLEPLTKAKDFDLEFSRNKAVRAAAKRALYVGPGEPPSIHAVFREDCWTGLAQGDYDSIYPALLLASRILDDPAVLPYFKGLFREDTWTEVDTQEKLNGPRYSFRAIPLGKSSDGQSFDIAEQKWLWLRLAEMGKCVRWSFGGNLQGSYGTTAATQALPGLVGGSCGSLVYLDQQYLDIMTGKTGMSDMAGVWTPGSDADSGMLRTCLHFAILLLHEFCHALRLATVSQRSDLSRPSDPYYGDQRKAEVGNAFEQKILSGGIVPILDCTEMRAPYGVSIHRWPNLQPAHVLEEQLASAGEWGARWSTEYPVSMDWVWSLFTVKFWDNDIAKHGLGALKPPRRIGFRWQAGGEREDLDMRIRALGSPDSVVSEEGDANAQGIVVRA